MAAKDDEAGQKEGPSSRISSFHAGEVGADAEQNSDWRRDKAQAG